MVSSGQAKPPLSLASLGPSFARGPQLAEASFGSGSGNFQQLMKVPTPAGGRASPAPPLSSSLVRRTPPAGGLGFAQGKCDTGLGRCRWSVGLASERSSAWSGVCVTL